jgi:plastocyanin
MRIFVAVTAFALTLAACSPAQTMNPPPSGNACPATITVQGGPGSYSYSVTSCTIKVAAEVTITANNTHPLIGSGLKTVNSATTDQTLSFATPGTFNFKCGIHGSMTGTITVE